MLMDTPRRLLYLFDRTDWKSRMPLAQKAREAGFDVTLALIGEPSGAAEEAKGFRIEYVKTTPGRMSIVSLAGMIVNIHRVIRRVKPDMVHTVTLKYSFVTGLACLLMRVRRVYTLAGLGYLFRSHGAKAAFLRRAISPVLKIVLAGSRTNLIFQNPDDLALMVRMGLAREERSHLVLGSGVDLGRFSPGSGFKKIDPSLVLMPTRLVREKGIDVFIDAARILRRSGRSEKFVIAGGLTKHNPSALTQQDMEALTADGTVEWLGHVENMPALLSSAALIVYPSWYGEGIPRVLLEAAAAGCPIITTDHPGCREVVEDGHNGLLVPIRDAAATARAMTSLLTDPARLEDMGKNGRHRAERLFALDHILGHTLAVYRAALAV
jgi:glycosyltransferase involved in cell wall biosynthesis